VTTLLLEIVNSVVATTLTGIGGALLSARGRQWSILLLAKLTGLGISHIYRQQRLANPHIPVELSRAQWVKVLAGRGNELTRDGFISLWTSPAKCPECVEVLLPNPQLGSDSWLCSREAEMRRVDPGIGPGLLAEQVRTNASYLLHVARRRGNLALRFYDLPNMFRVIATDQVAYITIYRSVEHGRNSPCIVARKPGVLYDLALSLFSNAWSHAKVVADMKIL